MITTKAILDLTQRYLEPHRTYHDIGHPVDLLTIAKKFEQELTNEQVLAIWYHDAIYVTGSSTNEEDSANLFMEHSVHDTDINRNLVRQIILDTKEEIPNVEESKLVIDLDLSGLGSSREQYAFNGSQIAIENAKVTTNQWFINREAWLEKFLGREFIYHTDWGREKFESTARENMEWELQGVKKMIELNKNLNR